MRLTVRLYAGLERPPSIRASGAPITLEIEECATVRAAVERLNLNVERIHLIFVNGAARGLDHPLADGDRVGLFPPVGGG